MLRGWEWSTCTGGRRRSLQAPGGRNLLETCKHNFEQVSFWYFNAQTDRLADTRDAVQHTRSCTGQWRHARSSTNTAATDSSLLSFSSVDPRSSGFHRGENNVSIENKEAEKGVAASAAVPRSIAQSQSGAKSANAHGSATCLHLRPSANTPSIDDRAAQSTPRVSRISRAPRLSPKDAIDIEQRIPAEIFRSRNAALHVLAARRRRMLYLPHPPEHAFPITRTPRTSTPSPARASHRVCARTPVRSSSTAEFRTSGGCPHPRVVEPAPFTLARAERNAAVSGKLASGYDKPNTHRRPGAPRSALASSQAPSIPESLSRFLNRLREAEQPAVSAHPAVVAIWSPLPDRVP
ncbi:hypothetical protein DFH06DRAFT_1146771 [Mycena polygramma]|nr:hypothetical protein DFH06DRAFT_1146771 [Mycena polygramma]